MLFCLSVSVGWMIILFSFSEYYGIVCVFLCLEIHQYHISNGFVLVQIVLSEICTVVYVLNEPIYSLFTSSNEKMFTSVGDYCYKEVNYFGRRNGYRNNYMLDNKTFLHLARMNFVF